MTKIFAFLLTASLLTSCATEDPYFRIKPATANEVANCRFVGNLSSSSRNYGLFDKTAAKERLKNAKQSAYNLGANRIVLDPAVENGNTTITDGKGYVCP